MMPLPVEALTALKLTPEQGRQYKEIWKAMHAEEASWSSQSRHRLVADAGHYIQFDRPDIVVDAVKSVVGKVRASR
jgi:pimeloyl-ACP methyl ester carboxylesterase